MNDKKKKGPSPQVEVIRRPGAVVAPVPRPADATAPAPAATPVAVQPRPSTAPVPVPVRPSVAPRPFPAAAGPKPALRPGGKPGFSRPPRPPGPLVPPTAEAINALAKKEKVPARIARGELEGKMKARIWRKLHAEEAKRFDQVYEMMSKDPTLELPDAFGALQSGLPPAEFLVRKAKTQKKAEVKQARGSVPAEAVNALIGGFIEGKTELALVLAERTLLDVLTGVEPVAFTLERAGRLEKLQICVLGRRAVWEQLSPGVDRDSKLAQKPQAIVRQPEKRPVSDPRPFLDHVGKALVLHLRNGLNLSLPLLAVGPFDLLIGDQGEELFIPLHAIIKWELAAG